jgi:hypothetical protein
MQAARGRPLEPIWGASAPWSPGVFLDEKPAKLAAPSHASRALQYERVSPGEVTCQGQMFRSVKETYHGVKSNIQKYQGCLHVLGRKSTSVRWARSIVVVPRTWYRPILILPMRPPANGHVATNGQKRLPRRLRDGLNGQKRLPLNGQKRLPLNGQKRLS